MNAQHHETITTGREFRETLRAGPFAWPGGYPLVFHCSDGGGLCFDCGRSEARQIIRAIRDKAPDDWRVTGCYVHWEGPPAGCDHCGRDIPSAYGYDEGAAA